jgi:hypothetical protein
VFFSDAAVADKYEDADEIVDVAPQHQGLMLRSSAALKSTANFLTGQSFDKDLYVDNSHEDNTSLVFSDVGDIKDDELNEENAVEPQTDNETSVAMQIKVKINFRLSHVELLPLNTKCDVNCHLNSHWSRTVLGMQRRALTDKMSENFRQSPQLSRFFTSRYYA